MKRYQEGLEAKMKGSSYIFERIDLLEYHLHKISLNRGSSYIISPKWLKNKGVKINPKNTKDNNYFQYEITAALNYQNIDHNSGRISKLKPFISNYNWKEIEFPSHSKDWEKFESSFLIYLDANNLHGWAMSKKLPVDGFKWVDDLSIYVYRRVYKKL